jgi:TrmH family RNA methyltransferase
MMTQMELSNALRKMIAGLGNSKNRRAEGLFIAEGRRCVLETMGHFRCRYLIATRQWVDEYASELRQVDNLVVTSAGEIARISQQKTPQPVIAVYEIPHPRLDTESLSGQLVIALDNVQDPGNMGTIVRIADWFGITTILCSKGTVDVYNSKVIQATMGAISRVDTHYVDLPQVLSKIKAPIFGTFLDGNDIYSSHLSANGIIVMGNEGNGISAEVAELVTDRLLIPAFPPGRDTVESLNVGVATAVTVAEFRRRML